MAARTLIDDPIFRKRRILRFWKCIDQSRGPDACWPWTGTRNAHGYGLVRFLGRYTTAHRVAYELYTGEIIPDHLKARHNCDNPPCCNPRHIVPGTQKQNLAEMRARGRIGDSRVFGETHGRCVLSDIQVAEIRDLYASGDYSQNQLAKKFGVGQTQIGRIVNGKGRIVTTNRDAFLIPKHDRKPGRRRKKDPRQLGLFL